MSKGYITNGTTQDGFGARIHRAINTMAFTFYLRDKWGVELEYVHTPLAFEGFGENFSAGEKIRSTCGRSNMITHNDYLNRAMLWDNRLCYNEIKIDDIDLNVIKVINDLDFDKGELLGNLTTNQIANKLYIVKYLHREFGNGILNTNIIHTYYSEIKNKFQFISSISNDNIEIHIRRSDAMGESARYLDDEYYLSILEALTPLKNKYDITIHTQRQGFNSSKYGDWHIVYDDEEEDFDAFIKMVCAKILIVGKSSFSIAAGFLNENVVVYPPQSTIGLNKWINKEQFIKSLNEHG